MSEQTTDRWQINDSDRKNAFYDETRSFVRDETTLPHSYAARAADDTHRHRVEPFFPHQREEP